MNTLSTVEYIWLDGAMPVNRLRSKSKIISLQSKPHISDFPYWSFDGSSTDQATGDNSDCLLMPVTFVKDPLENNGDYLVLCEVLNHDKTVHVSNNRAKLRQILDDGGNDHDVWLGFEQEYTMFDGMTPLGWPEHGYPSPQGPYYCGVGSKQIFGREIANEHRKACIDAGLLYFGMNAEVMLGQWEFQIGYRGISNEDAGALNISDHTWIARWLIHRISEKYNIHISFDNKPIKGDWNGAGMHTNFSTKEIRDPKLGPEAINIAIKKLCITHAKHIQQYGDKLEERLTGNHETSNISEFSSGLANRTSSIRVPHTGTYLEDRRPGANADPYVVSALLISSICN